MTDFSWADAQLPDWADRGFAKDRPTMRELADGHRARRSLVHTYCEVCLTAGGGIGRSLCSASMTTLNAIATDLTGRQVCVVCEVLHHQPCERCGS